MEESIFKKCINPLWMNIFEEIDSEIREITEEEYKKIKEKPNIFPTFDNIFNFTKYCSFEDVKVLIIGQDPYPGVFLNKKDGMEYPQATGLAFSVPKNSPIPKSLVNIYENLSRFGHQQITPTHGNLDFWAYQGVLLLNTSLTVEKSKPNSHQNIWTMYSDELIKTITSKHPGLVIVMWGGSAFSKMNIIKNKEKHDFVISSHPSPLGFKNKMKNYNSFYDTDHFGLINKFLKSKNKQEINWQII